MKNPYLLSDSEKDYAMDLFASAKPLSVVKKEIAALKEIPEITKEINENLDRALRCVNPNHSLCSKKNWKTINDRKKKQKKDEERAVFNIAGLLLSASEELIENTAVEIVKAVVESVNNPRQLKAFIESLEMLSTAGNDWIEDDDDSTESGDDAKSGESKRTLEAFKRILGGD